MISLAFSLTLWLGMLVNRNNNQITITVSEKLDSFSLQRIIAYVEYLEASVTSKAKQADADKMAESVNADWWKKNRKRFVK